MPQLIDKGLGLERIQREAFLVLFQKLNEELSLLESAWATLDQQLAAETGRNFGTITLEAVEDFNFHMGHRPSLIEAPIGRYPNVSVMAYQSRADGVAGIDQMVQLSDRLFIECMVKSPHYETTEAQAEINDQVEAERIVNARIQRMTDAVNNVIQSNRTLNKTVQEITAVPNVLISDVFPRAERTSYGPMWLWQGSRLEYEVSKLSHLDEDASILGSGFVRREGLNIDQVP
jgi:hypothetical protein